MAGGIGGGVLSPNKASVVPNVLLFTAIGAAAASAGSYYLYRSNPENWELPPMKLETEERKNFNKEEVNPFNPIINLKNEKKYAVPVEPLPENLRGKVKKQYLLEYYTPEQTMQVGDKTLLISPIKAWEHHYE